MCSEEEATSEGSRFSFNHRFEGELVETVGASLAEIRQAAGFKLVESDWLPDVGSQSTTIIVCDGDKIAREFNYRPAMIDFMKHDKVCVVKLKLHGHQIKVSY